MHILYAFVSLTWPLQDWAYSPGYIEQQQQQIDFGMWDVERKKRKLSSPTKEDLGVEVIALLESVIHNCSIKLTTHYYWAVQVDIDWCCCTYIIRTTMWQWMGAGNNKMAGIF